MKHDLNGPKNKTKKQSIFKRFKNAHPMMSWAILATLLTIVLSSTFSFLSETLLSNAGITISMIIAIFFILLNVLTDTLGVAVTAATLPPFLSMASRKVPGAHESIKLIKNADKISNICSDIIGDICGIMSGAVGANMVVTILSLNNFSINAIFLSILISTAIAGFTVFLKAIGKYLACNNYTQIVLFTGKVIKFFKFKKNKKTK